MDKKFKSRAILGGIFFVLMLVGTGAAYFLTQQSQDIRQQASGGCKVGDPYCSCDVNGNNCVEVDENGARVAVDQGGDLNKAGILATSYTGSRPTTEGGCGGGVWKESLSFCYMPGDELAGGVVVVASGRYNYPYFEKKEAVDNPGYGGETVTQRLGTKEELGEDCGGKGLSVQGVCYSYGSNVNGFLVMPVRTENCDNSTGDYCHAHLEKIDTNYDDWQQAVTAYEDSGDYSQLEKLYQDTYGISFSDGALFDPQAVNASQLRAQALISALTNADVLKGKAAEQNAALEELLKTNGELNENQQALYDFNQELITAERVSYQQLDQLAKSTAQLSVSNQTTKEIFDEFATAEDAGELDQIVANKFKEVYGYDPAEKYSNTNGVLAALGIDVEELNTYRADYQELASQQAESSQTGGSQVGAEQTTTGTSNASGQTTGTTYDLSALANQLPGEDVDTILGIDPVAEAKARQALNTINGYLSGTLSRDDLVSAAGLPPTIGRSMTTEAILGSLYREAGYENAASAQAAQSALANKKTALAINSYLSGQVDKATLAKEAGLPEAVANSMTTEAILGTLYQKLGNDIATSGQKAKEVMAVKTEGLREGVLTTAYQRNPSNTTALEQLYEYYTDKKPAWNQGQTTKEDLLKEISKHNSQVALTAYINSGDTNYLQVNYLTNHSTPDKTVGVVPNDKKELLQGIFGQELGAGYYNSYVLSGEINTAINSFDQNSGELETVCSKALGTACNLVADNAAEKLGEMYRLAYASQNSDDDPSNDVNVSELAATTVNQLFESRRQSQNQLATTTLDDFLSQEAAQAKALGGLELPNVSVAAVQAAEQARAASDQTFSNYSQAYQMSNFFNHENTLAYFSQDEVRSQLSDYVYGGVLGNSTMYGNVLRNNYDLGIKDSVFLGLNQVITQMGVGNTVENIATNYERALRYDYTGPADTLAADVAFKAGENFNANAFGFDYQPATNNGSYYSSRVVAEMGMGAANLASQAVFTLGDTFFAVGDLANVQARQFDIPTTLAKHFSTGVAEDFGISKAAYIQFNTEQEVVRSRRELQWETVEKVVAPAIALATMPLAIASGAGMGVVTGLNSGSWSFYQAAGQKAQALELERTVISQDINDGKRVAALANVKNLMDRDEALSYDAAYDLASAQVDEQIITMNKQANMMLANSAIAFINSGAGVIQGFTKTANALTSTMSWAGRGGGIALSGVTAVNSTQQALLAKQKLANLDQLAIEQHLTRVEKEELRSSLQGQVWASGVSGAVAFLGGVSNSLNALNQINAKTQWFDPQKLANISTVGDMRIDYASFVGEAVDLQNISQSCFTSNYAIDETACRDAWIGLALSITQDVVQVRNSKQARQDFQVEVNKQNIAADYMQHIALMDADLNRYQSSETRTPTDIANMAEIFLARQKYAAQALKLNPQLVIPDLTRKIFPTVAEVDLGRITTAAQAEYQKLAQSIADLESDAVNVETWIKLSEALELKQAHQESIVRTYQDIRALDQEMVRVATTDVDDYQNQRSLLVQTLATKISDSNLRLSDEVEVLNKQLLVIAQNNPIGESQHFIAAAQAQANKLASLNESLKPPAITEGEAARVTQSSSPELERAQALQRLDATLQEVETTTSLRNQLQAQRDEYGRTLGVDIDKNTDPLYAKLQASIHDLSNQINTAHNRIDSYLKNLTPATQPKIWQRIFGGATSAKTLAAYDQGMTTRREMSRLNQEMQALAKKITQQVTQEEIRTTYEQINERNTEYQRLATSLSSSGIMQRAQAAVATGEAPKSRLAAALGALASPRQAWSDFVEARQTRRRLTDLKKIAPALATEEHLQAARELARLEMDRARLLVSEDNQIKALALAELDDQITELRGQVLYEVDQSGDYTQFKLSDYGKTLLGDKAEEKLFATINERLESFERYKRKKIPGFSIYSRVHETKNQDIVLMAELAAFGSNNRGLVNGASMGLGKNEVVEPFNILLKQVLTGDPQFMVFPEAKLMKPWVTDSNYTPNEDFIRYVEGEFGKGSVVIVKPNESIDSSVIGKAKFIITTKDVAFDLQSTTRDTGLALRAKWKNSYIHADEVDWTFNPNESYKLSGRQVDLQKKPEYSLYLEAQRQVLGIDENGQDTGDGLSSLKALIFELEQSKSVSEGVRRTADGKSGQIIDEALERRILTEWLESWDGQDRVANLDLAGDIEQVRKAINTHLTRNPAPDTHQLRAELAMINETVNLLSRVPGEDYGLTSNIKNGETIYSIAPREQNRISGRSYSAVAEQLLYNSVGAKVLGVTDQVDITKLTVGESGSDINYAQLMLESKGFSLYTGTPETVAKLYKMAYGIDLAVFSDSGAVDAIKRFNKPPNGRGSEIFGGGDALERQLAARIDDYENQVFVNMAAGKRSNQAALIELIDSLNRVVVQQAAGFENPYKKVFVIGANGELVEYDLMNGQLQRGKTFPDTKQLNTYTSDLDKSQRYIKFYEYGAHVGVDTANDVAISRAVGICAGCDETTFGQGINRVRISVDPSVKPAKVTYAPIDVVWLDGPTRTTINDFADSIRGQQVINEALAEVQFKETLLRNSVDSTFGELIKLAENGGGGLLRYRANAKLVTKLEGAYQRWKEASEMNYLLGSDDLTAAKKLAKTAEQVRAVYAELEGIVKGERAPERLLAQRAAGALGAESEQIRLAFVSDDAYRPLGETPSYREIVELINNSSKHLDDVDVAYTDRRSPPEVVRQRVAEIAEDGVTVRTGDVADDGGGSTRPGVGGADAVATAVRDLAAITANPLKMAAGGQALTRAARTLASAFGRYLAQAGLKLADLSNRVLNSEHGPVIADVLDVEITDKPKGGLMAVRNLQTWATGKDWWKRIESARHPQEVKERRKQIFVELEITDPATQERFYAIDDIDNLNQEAYRFLNLKRRSLGLVLLTTINEQVYVDELKALARQVADIEKAQRNSGLVYARTNENGSLSVDEVGRYVLRDQGEYMDVAEFLDAAHAKQVVTTKEGSSVSPFSTSCSSCHDILLQVLKARTQVRSSQEQGDTQAALQTIDEAWWKIANTHGMDNQCFQYYFNSLLAADQAALRKTQPYIERAIDLVHAGTVLADGLLTKDTMKVKGVEQTLSPDDRAEIKAIRDGGKILTDDGNEIEVEGLTSLAEFGKDSQGRANRQKLIGGSLKDLLAEAQGNFFTDLGDKARIAISNARTVWRWWAGVSSQSEEADIKKNQGMLQSEEDLSSNISNEKVASEDTLVYVVGIKSDVRNPLLSVPEAKEYLLISGDESFDTRYGDRFYGVQQVLEHLNILLEQGYITDLESLIRTSFDPKTPQGEFTFKVNGEEKLIKFYRLGIEFTDEKSYGDTLDTASVPDELLTVFMNEEEIGYVYEDSPIIFGNGSDSFMDNPIPFALKEGINSRLKPDGIIVVNTTKDQPRFVNPKLYVDSRISLNRYGASFIKNAIYGEIVGSDITLIRLELTHNPEDQISDHDLIFLRRTSFIGTHSGLRAVISKLRQGINTWWKTITHTKQIVELTGGVDPVYLESQRSWELSVPQMVESGSERIKTVYKETDEKAEKLFGYIVKHRGRVDRFTPMWIKRIMNTLAYLDVRVSINPDYRELTLATLKLTYFFAMLSEQPLDKFINGSVKYFDKSSKEFNRIVSSTSYKKKPFKILDKADVVFLPNKNDIVAFYWKGYDLIALGESVLSSVNRESNYGILFHEWLHQIQQQNGWDEAMAMRLPNRRAITKLKEGVTLWAEKEFMIINGIGDVPLGLTKDYERFYRNVEDVFRAKLVDKGYKDENIKALFLLTAAVDPHYLALALGDDDIVVGWKIIEDVLEATELPDIHQDSNQRYQTREIIYNITDLKDFSADNESQEGVSQPQQTQLKFSNLRTRLWRRVTTLLDQARVWVSQAKMWRGQISAEEEVEKNTVFGRGGWMGRVESWAQGLWNAINDQNLYLMPPTMQRLVTVFDQAEDQPGPQNVSDAELKTANFPSLDSAQLLATGVNSVEAESANHIFTQITDTIPFVFAEPLNQGITAEELILLNVISEDLAEIYNSLSTATQQILARAIQAEIDAYHQDKINSSQLAVESKSDLQPTSTSTVNENQFSFGARVVQQAQGLIAKFTSPKLTRADLKIAEETSELGAETIADVYSKAVKEKRDQKEAEQYLTRSIREFQEKGSLLPRTDEMYDVFRNIIARVTSLPKYKKYQGFDFYISLEDSINAYTVPQQKAIVFYAGLIQKAEEFLQKKGRVLNEDFLAFIVYHELSHWDPEGEVFHLNENYADTHALQMVSDAGYSTDMAVLGAEFLEYIEDKSSQERGTDDKQDEGWRPIGITHPSSESRRVLIVSINNDYTIYLPGRGIKPTPVNKQIRDNFRQKSIAWLDQARAVQEISTPEELVAAYKQAGSISQLIEITISGKQLVTSEVMRQMADSHELEKLLLIEALLQERHDLAYPFNLERDDFLTQHRANLVTIEAPHNLVNFDLKLKDNSLGDYVDSTVEKKVLAAAIEDILAGKIKDPLGVLTGASDELVRLYPQLKSIHFDNFFSKVVSSTTGFIQSEYGRNPDIRRAEVLHLSQFVNQDLELDKKYFVYQGSKRRREMPQNRAGLLDKLKVALINNLVINRGRYYGATYFADNEPLFEYVKQKITARLAELPITNQTVGVITRLGSYETPQFPIRLANVINRSIIGYQTNQINLPESEVKVSTSDVISAFFRQPLILSQGGSELANVFGVPRGALSYMRMVRGHLDHLISDEYSPTDEGTKLQLISLLGSNTAWFSGHWAKLAGEKRTDSHYPENNDPKDFSLDMIINPGGQVGREIYKQKKKYSDPEELETTVSTLTDLPTIKRLLLASSNSRIDTIYELAHNQFLVSNPSLIRELLLLGINQRVLSPLEIITLLSGAKDVALFREFKDYVVGRQSPEFYALWFEELKNLPINKDKTELEVAIEFISQGGIVDFNSQNQGLGFQQYGYPLVTTDYSGQITLDQKYLPEDLLTLSQVIDAAVNTNPDQYSRVEKERMQRIATLLAMNALGIPGELTKLDVDQVGEPGQAQTIDELLGLVQKLPSSLQRDNYLASLLSERTQYSRGLAATKYDIYGSAQNPHQFLVSIFSSLSAEFYEGFDFVDAEGRLGAIRIPGVTFSANIDDKSDEVSNKFIFKNSVPKEATPYGNAYELNRVFIKALNRVFHEDHVLSNPQLLLAERIRRLSEIIPHQGNMRDYLLEKFFFYHRQELEDLTDDELVAGLKQAYEAADEDGRTKSMIGIKLARANLDKVRNARGPSFTFEDGLQAITQYLDGYSEARDALIHGLLNTTPTNETDIAKAKELLLGYVFTTKTTGQAIRNAGVEVIASIAQQQSTLGLINILQVMIDPKSKFDKSKSLALLFEQPFVKENLRVALSKEVKKNEITGKMEEGLDPLYGANFDQVYAGVVDYLLAKYDKEYKVTGQQDQLSDKVKKWLDRQFEIRRSILKLATPKVLNTVLGSIVGSQQTTATGLLDVFASATNTERRHLMYRLGLGQRGFFEDQNFFKKVDSDDFGDITYGQLVINTFINIATQDSRGKDGWSESEIKKLKTVVHTAFASISPQQRTETMTKVLNAVVVSNGNVSKEELIQIGLSSFGVVGAKLAQMDTLFPESLASFLEELKEDAPSLPETLVWDILKKEGRIYEPGINEAPDTIVSLGANINNASTAVVYTARRHDGKEIIIKFIRPDVKENYRADLEAAAKAITSLHAEGVIEVDPSQIVAELGQLIAEEIDPRKEAQNIVEVRERQERYELETGKEGVNVDIPEVFNVSSSRIEISIANGLSLLEIETIQKIKAIQDGQGSFDDLSDKVKNKYGLEKLEDIDNLVLDQRYVDLDLTPVYKQIIARFFHESFNLGLFHSDPHEGNIFIDHDGKLTFIDWGQVGRVEEVEHEVSVARREALFDYLLGIILEDTGLIAQALHVYKPEVEIDEIKTSLKQVQQEAHAKNPDQSPTQRQKAFLRSITAFMSEAKISGSIVIFTKALINDVSYLQTIIQSAEAEPLVLPKYLLRIRQIFDYRWIRKIVRLNQQQLDQLNGRLAEVELVLGQAQSLVSLMSPYLESRQTQIFEIVESYFDPALSQVTEVRLSAAQKQALFEVIWETMVEGRGSSRMTQALQDFNLIKFIGQSFLPAWMQRVFFNQAEQNSINVEEKITKAGAGEDSIQQDEVVDPTTELGGRYSSTFFTDLIPSAAIALLPDRIAIQEVLQDTLSKGAPLRVWATSNWTRVKAWLEGIGGRSGEEETIIENTPTKSQPTEINLEHQHALDRIVDLSEKIFRNQASAEQFPTLKEFIILYNEKFSIDGMGKVDPSQIKELDEEINMLVEGTNRLIEFSRTQELDSLVFLDKSSRLVGHLFRHGWRSKYPERKMPNIAYVNIGAPKQFSSGKVDFNNDETINGLASALSPFVNQNGRIAVVDEYGETGKSLLNAKQTFQTLYPQATVLATYAFLGHPFWTPLGETKEIFDIDDYFRISLRESSHLLRDGVTTTFFAKGIRNVLELDKYQQLRDLTSQEEISVFLQAAKSSAKVGALRAELSQLATQVKTMAIQEIKESLLPERLDPEVKDALLTIETRTNEEVSNSDLETVSNSLSTQEIKAPATFAERIDDAINPNTDCLSYSPLLVTPVYAAKDQRTDVILGAATAPCGFFERTLVRATALFPKFIGMDDEEVLSYLQRNLSPGMIGWSVLEDVSINLQPTVVDFSLENTMREQEILLTNSHLEKVEKIMWWGDDGYGKTTFLRELSSFYSSQGKIPRFLLGTSFRNYKNARNMVNSVKDMIEDPNSSKFVIFIDSMDYIWETTEGSLAPEVKALKLEFVELLLKSDLQVVMTSHQEEPKNKDTDFEMKRAVFQLIEAAVKREEFVSRELSAKYESSKVQRLLAELGIEPDIISALIEDDKITRHALLRNYFLTQEELPRLLRWLDSPVLSLKNKACTVLDVVKGRNWQRRHDLCTIGF